MTVWDFLNMLHSLVPYERDVVMLVPPDPLLREL